MVVVFPGRIGSFEYSGWVHPHDFTTSAMMMGSFVVLVQLNSKEAGIPCFNSPKSLTVVSNFNFSGALGVPGAMGVAGVCAKLAVKIKQRRKLKIVFIESEFRLLIVLMRQR